MVKYGSAFYYEEIDADNQATIFIPKIFTTT